MERVEAITNDPKQRLNTEQFAALFQGVQALETRPPAPNFSKTEEAPVDLPKESRVTGMRELGYSSQNDFNQQGSKNNFATYA
ncbi:MAG: hypothetical protein OXU45_04935 [Candidatus Melainabacteria bacterium]|nr:hypothetical protein [Candidatus Melainabacteria bacterium]